MLRSAKVGMPAQRELRRLSLLLIGCMSEVWGYLWGKLDKPSSLAHLILTLKPGRYFTPSQVPSPEFINSSARSPVQRLTASSRFAS